MQKQRTIKSVKPGGCVCVHFHSCSLRAAHKAYKACFILSKRIQSFTDTQSARKMHHAICILSHTPKHTSIESIAPVPHLRTKVHYFLIKIHVHFSPFTIPPLPSAAVTLRVRDYPHFQQACKKVLLQIKSEETHGCGLRQSLFQLQA